MAKKIITIKLSGENIKICEIKKKKNSIYVYNAINLDMPQGVYDDGNLKNINVLAESIQHALFRAKIKPSNVMFSINSSRIANREVVIPYVKDEKIKDIIEMNSNEYFPVDVREYVFTYSIIEKVKTKLEKNIKLMVYAAPDSIIDNYYKLAHMLKMEVSAIDYAGNSSYQLIKRQHEDGVNMFIQSGMDSTTITVVQKDKLLLQRVIAYGMMNIIESVMESEVFNVNSIEKSIELLNSKYSLWVANSETAYSTLRQGDVGEEFNKEAIRKIEAEKRASENVNDAVMYLINNIVRVIDYYKLKNRDLNIGTILLAGVGANFKGMKDLLKNELDVDVKVLESIIGVQLSKKAKKAVNPIQMLPNLGVAFNPVMFTSKEVSTKEKRRKSTGVALRMLFLSILASTALVVVSIFFYNQSLLGKSEIENKISVIEDISSLINDYNSEKLRTEEIIHAYNSTKNNNEQLLTFITDLEEVMPSRMQFSNISCSDGIISMQGVTDARSSVAKLIVNLKGLDYVFDVKVSQISEVEDENGIKTVNFPLTCRIIYLTTEE